MDRVGEHHDEMWDEEDGFFYDLLRLPDGRRHTPESPFDGRPASPLRLHRFRQRSRGALPRAFSSELASFSGNIRN